MQVNFVLFSQSHVGHLQRLSWSVQYFILREKTLITRNTRCKNLWIVLIDLGLKNMAERATFATGTASGEVWNMY